MLYQLSYVRVGPFYPGSEGVPAGGEPRERRRRLRQRRRRSRPSTWRRPPWHPDKSLGVAPFNAAALTPPRDVVGCGSV